MNNRATNKPKVIFLSPVAHLKGGAEKCLLDFVQNPNIDPVIVSPEEGEILQTGREWKIPSYVVSFGSINNVHRPFSFIKSLNVLKSLFKAALDLKKVSKETSATLVHSNGLKAHMINCVSRQLGGGKAIVHIHDIPYTKQETIIWYILYFMCDAMMMDSRPCWPGKKLPPKCKVIHYGISLAEIPETNKAKEKSPGSTITIGFAGRIHPGKGLHLLLDWIAAARKKNLNVELSVRGSFSEDAPQYEAELKNQIKQLNITDYVEFLGYVSDPTLIYKDLDIVVVPSKAPDPLPRSVMESMAHGIPVFGYPAGGIPEMIEDKKTGFLVHDATSFCDTLNLLLSDPQKLQEISKAAREKVRNDFNFEKAYANYCEVYNALLNGSFYHKN